MLEKIKDRKYWIPITGLLLYSLISVLMSWDYGNRFICWNQRIPPTFVLTGVVYYGLHQRFSMKLLQQKDYTVFIVRIAIGFLFLCGLTVFLIHILIPEENILKSLEFAIPKNKKMSADTLKGMKIGLIWGVKISYAIYKALIDSVFVALILYFQSKELPQITQNTDETENKIRLYSWHVIVWMLWILAFHWNKFDYISKNPSSIFTILLLTGVSVGFFFLSYRTTYKLVLRKHYFSALFLLGVWWLVAVYTKALIFGILVSSFNLPPLFYGVDTSIAAKKALEILNKMPVAIGAEGYQKFSIYSGQALLIGARKELIVLLAAFGYGYARESVRYEKRLREIAVERQKEIEQQQQLEKLTLTAQIQALKAQINPHFLFNSLNFLYSKAINYSDELGRAMMLLSEIMQYAMKESNHEDKVPLENEIKHLQNFIDFNQLRFSNRLFIDFEVEGNPRFRRILPLLLITFVENAFKYGELMDEKNPLKIFLKIEENQLYFNVLNKKNQGPKELSTGFGLENIRQRLHLAYPEKHSLEIINSDLFYQIELKVEI